MGHLTKNHRLTENLGCALRVFILINGAKSTKDQTRILQMFTNPDGRCTAKVIYVCIKVGSDWVQFDFPTLVTGLTETPDLQSFFLFGGPTHSPGFI